MKTKILKSIMMCLVFVIMAVVMFLIDSATVIDAGAGAYFVVLGVFLGLDVKSMIQSTNIKTAVGDYEAINTYKYIIALIQMLVLAGLAMYQYKVGGVEIQITLGLFVVGAILIIGIFLGALEANKLVTTKA